MAVAPKHKGLEVLRKLVPLNTLSDEALRGLVKSVRFEKVKKGEYLFQAGDTDNQAVYLLSGRVALLSGKQEVDTVAAGSDTARFPLSHQIPRKFSVMAGTRAELVRVDNRMLGELLAKDDVATKKMSKSKPDVPDDWMSQLLQMRVFQRIPPSNIQRVIMDMEEVELDKGDVVFRQGDKGDYFYLLNKGYCSVTCTAGDQVEEELVKLGPGDSFGEEALLSDCPRVGTASMLTEGLLVRLKKADFVRYVKDPLAHDLTYKQAAEAVEEGSLWLDVRPSDAFDKWHMPDSISLPVRSLRFQSSNLDRDRSYIVYCENGQQSAAAAFLLFEQGIDVSVLKDGMKSMPEEVGVMDASAEVISLHPEQASSAISAPEPEVREQASDAGELQSRLAKAETQAREQGAYLKRYKQALAETKKQLAERDVRLNENEVQARSLRGEHDLLEARLNELEEIQGQLHQRDEELDAANVRIADFESKLAEREISVEELQVEHQRSLGDLTGQLEEGKARESKTQKKLQALKENKTKIGGTLDAATAQISELESKLAERESSADEQHVLHRKALEELQRQLAEEQAQAAESLSAATDEIADFKTRLAERETSGDELQAAHQQALDALNRKLEEQQARQTETQRQLASRDEEKGERDEELSAAGDQIADLESKLAKRESSAEELQRQLEEGRAQESKTQKKLRTLKENKEKIGVTLDAATSRVSELESKLADRESSGEEQQGLHRKALEELQQQLTEEQAQAADSLSAATDEVTDLKTRLAERESSGEEQQSAHRKALEELQRQLTEEQVQAAESLSAATDEVTDLNTRLAERDLSGDELQAAHQQALEALGKKLEEEQAQAADSLSAATDEVAELKTRLAEHDLSGDELQAAHQRALEALGKRLEEEQARLAETQRQLASREEEKNKGEEELNAAGDQIAGLESKLAERETNAEELQRQLEEEQMRAGEALSTTAIQVAELESKLAEGESNSGALQAQHEKALEALQHQLEEEQARTGESLSAGTARIAELESKLEERENSGKEQAAAHQKALEELQKQLEEEQTRTGESLSAGTARIAELESKLAERESSGKEQAAAHQKALEELQQQLADSAEELAATKAQAENHSRSEGEPDRDPDTKALQAELTTLSSALEDSDKAYEQANERAGQLEAELEVLRKGTGSVDDETVSKLNAAGKEKALLQDKVERLQGEVAELRGVIEQYMGQIQEAQAGVEGEDATALRSELELVREQAEVDLARMREELLQAQGSAKAKSIPGAVGGTGASTVEHQRLEGEIEAKSSEIDRLKQALDSSKVEAEEAQFRRQEEIDARKQLEESLFQAKQEVEESRLREFSESISSTAEKRRAMGEDSAAPARGRGWAGLLIGAVLAFGIADGLSIMGGKGELISAFFPVDDWAGRVRQALGTVIPTSPGNRLPEQTSEQEEPEVVQPDKAESGAIGPGEPAPTPVAGLAAGTIILDRLSAGGRGPVMLHIPGGRFTMGWEHDQLVADERPAHMVDIKDFAIGRSEVSFNEYERFARATGRPVPDDMGWGRGQRPVINVSWEAASAYAGWLSAQTGKRYRLPTEAEWEYAAAGGNYGFYWWGYSFEEGHANCFDCGVRWSGKSTAPVGSFKANPYGLYDALGNVMEWVQDCYHDSYQGAPVNGSAWVEPGCRERVARGGAFNKPGDSLKLMNRSHYPADEGLFMLGFRLVREVR